MELRLTILALGSTSRHIRLVSWQDLPRSSGQGPVAEPVVTQWFTAASVQRTWRCCTRCSSPNLCHGATLDWCQFPSTIASSFLAKSHALDSRVQTSHHCQKLASVHSTINLSIGTFKICHHVALSRLPLGTFFETLALASEVPVLQAHICVVLDGVLPV